jgi:hypothetical protein
MVKTVNKQRFGCSRFDYLRDSLRIRGEYLKSLYEYLIGKHIKQLRASPCRSCLASPSGLSLFVPLKLAQKVSLSESFAFYLILVVCLLPSKGRRLYSSGVLWLVAALFV